ncbi:UNVERIFIED_CONTAM: hypothetical protein FKN15_044786 [Acipenser sinensis]
MRSPGLKGINQEHFLYNHINKIPFYKDLCEHMKAGVNCEKLVGYSAVYKVCFGMACFFFIFALFTIKVQDSTSCRAHVHNGFWFMKFAVLLACCSGAFFIPDQDTLCKVLGIMDMTGQALGIMDMTGQALGIMDMTGQALGIMDMTGQPLGIMDMTGQPLGIMDMTGQALGIMDMTGQALGIWT